MAILQHLSLRPLSQGSCRYRGRALPLSWANYCIILILGAVLLSGSFSTCDLDTRTLDGLEQTVLKLCQTAEEFTENFVDHDARECVYYDTCDPQLERRIPSFKCVKGFGTDKECKCEGERLSLKYPVVSIYQDCSIYNVKSDSVFSTHC